MLHSVDSKSKVYATGMIFQFSYNIIAAVLRGIGDSKATLYFLLVASVINVVLDILFVFHMEMGVVGAANVLMTTQETCIGQNIGAGKFDRVMTGARHTVILSEIISVCIPAAVSIFAGQIVTAFGLGEEAAGYCLAPPLLQFFHK